MAEGPGLGMMHPLPVALEASPSDYPGYVADLLDSAYEAATPPPKRLVTRERILGDYHRFAAENPRKAKFFLTAFASKTAKRLTGLLPRLVQEIERGTMALAEDATIVLVPLTVLEEGVRVWVLRDEPAESRGEP